MKNLNKMTTLLFLMLFLFIFSACQMGSDLENLLEEKIALDNQIPENQENPPDDSPTVPSYGAEIDIKPLGASSENLSLNWVEPDDSEFSHVEIYLESEPDTIYTIASGERPDLNLNLLSYGNNELTVYGYAVNKEGVKGPVDHLTLLWPNGADVIYTCVSTAADLANLSSTSSMFDDNIIQTEDIDLSGYNWDPIGSAGNPFIGVYQGSNYKIKNLFIDKSDTDSLGLFGVIEVGGTVRRVLMENVDITGRNLLGSLAGELNGGSYIVDCYAQGSIKGNSTDYAGGLVGSVSRSIVERSYTDMSITNCFRFIGGIAGLLQGESGYTTQIINCYTRGNLYAYEMLGGLIGQQTAESSIEKCYAAVAIGSGNGWVGGLSGTDTVANINDSFYDSDVITYSSVSAGYGTPKTTSEMKSQSTYVWWDFTGETSNGSDDIWSIDTSGVINDGYPYLTNNPPRS